MAGKSDIGQPSEEDCGAVPDPREDVPTAPLPKDDTGSSIADTIESSRPQTATVISLEALARRAGLHIEDK